MQYFLACQRMAEAANRTCLGEQGWRLGAGVQMGASAAGQRVKQTDAGECPTA
jgi:hypothetical protein